jgi:hypothetical protein
MGPGVTVVDLHRHAMVLHVHIAQVGWEGENHPVGQGGQGAALQQEQEHDRSEQQFVLSGKNKSSHYRASFAMSSCSTFPKASKMHRPDVLALFR